jgi:hypothetical protein
MIAQAWPLTLLADRWRGGSARETASSTFKAPRLGSIPHRATAGSVASPSLGIRWISKTEFRTLDTEAGSTQPRFCRSK